MTPQLSQALPEDLLIVPSDFILDLTLALDLAGTSRTLTITVDGVVRLSWIAGFATLTAGYTGGVTVTAGVLHATLSRDAGWASGGHEWNTAYSDSTGTLSDTRYFAIVGVSSVIRTPALGATGVPRRAQIYGAFDFDAGVALGADLEIAGERAVRDGEVLTPQYEGRSGAESMRSYVAVTTRRAWAWSARVDVIFRPRVSISGSAYFARIPVQFTTADRPGSPSFRADPGPLVNPVAEAVRQRTAACLRCRGASPTLYTVCLFFLMRSEVGTLAKPYLPKNLSVHLVEEDIPSGDEIATLLSDLAPLWTALVGTVCPPEDRDSVLAAWQSRHPVEQLGAVCLMIFYAFGGRDGV